MNGLLLKEVLILRSYWKTYGLLVAFYAVFSFTGSATFFSSMMSVILFIVPLSSFSADELARWDKFAAALPGGRRAVVNAKYQFLLMLMVGIVLIACVINLLVSLVRRETDASFPDLMVAALSCGGVGLLLNCVLYPFLFKYGTQKARIAMAIIFGVVFALIAMGLAAVNLGGGISALELTFSPVTVTAIAVVVLVAAVLLSYRLSCRIYENREF